MSLSTEVQICNAALRRIGITRRIETLTDNSAEADACNAEYAHARDSVLRDHPWRFAKVYSSLSVDTAGPAWYWTYQYELPSNCLLFLGLEYEDYPYEIVSDPSSDRRLVMTNVAGPLKVRYIKRVTDVSQMDAMFKEALVLKLAARIVLSLSADLNRLDALETLYRTAVEDARFADSSEQSYQPLDSSTFIRARLIGPEAVDSSGDLQ